MKSDKIGLFRPQSTTVWDFQYVPLAPSQDKCAFSLEHLSSNIKLKNYRKHWKATSCFVCSLVFSVCFCFPHLRRAPQIMNVKTVRILELKHSISIPLRTSNNTHIYYISWRQNCRRTDHANLYFWFQCFSCEICDHINCTLGLIAKLTRKTLRFVRWQFCHHGMLNVYVSARSSN